MSDSKEVLRFWMAWTERAEERDVYLEGTSDAYNKCVKLIDELAAFHQGERFSHGYKILSEDDVQRSLRELSKEDFYFEDADVFIEGMEAYIEEIYTQRRDELEYDLKGLDEDLDELKQTAKETRARIDSAEEEVAEKRGELTLLDDRLEVLRRQAIEAELRRRGLLA
ncbi:hypothetical protein [Bosea sp. 124]|jgi:chromosome segregation ATPase|uniref:hypothetical protein n=1 Tax=Bosea sp. 124 TaxID=2135642 RepID=UPI000D385146|nr:hypothetical protein [Bosea sp. 124]PTM40596.1 hypothetical protein C8D03_2124 [Bosea sp. 124]